MRALNCLGMALLLSLPAAAQADNSDSAAARAHLQSGYALKQGNKCHDAILHFRESIRLDRTLKAIVNLADCEEKVGKLSAAQAHFVEARDLASSLHAVELLSVANQRLQALERKMPKLVIKVAQGAPQGTVVTRDGVELGPVSLGMPLPLDPGNHVIIARNEAFERQYDVTLTEGQTQELEVTPSGGKALLPRAAKPLEGSTATATATAEPVPDKPGFGAASNSLATPGSSGWTGRQTGALVLAGFGVVGVGVGTALALSAKSDWQSTAGACPNNTCSDMQTQEDGNNARRRANLATVPIAAGAVALAVGGVVWLTAPKSSSATAIRVTPIIQASSGAIYFEGGF
jgi:hypothetical protein